MLSSVSDKAKWFTKTDLKLHNISATSKIVKKVIMNLDSSNASATNYIPVMVLKNYEPELSYILTEIFSMCLKRVLFSRLLEGLIGGPCL